MNMMRSRISTLAIYRLAVYSSGRYHQVLVTFYPDLVTMDTRMKWVNIALRRSAQYSDRRKHEVATVPYSYRMTPRVLYSAQYHRHHCTLHAFEQFGALFMHSPNDKHPTQPEFEPSTSEPHPVQMSHRGRRYKDQNCTLAVTMEISHAVTEPTWIVTGDNSIFRNTQELDQRQQAPRDCRL